MEIRPFKTVTGKYICYAAGRKICSIRQSSNSTQIVELIVKSKSFLIVFSCAVSLFLAVHGYVTPRAQTAVSPAAAVHDGQDIFNRTCMQCHSVVEGQYSFGPNLAGELKKPHPRKTPVEVKGIVKNGKGKMPPLGDKLTDQEIDHVIAYLRTM